MQLNVPLILISPLRAGYVFSVAQSCTLPYRRFVICAASQRANAWDRSDTLPNIIRRYGRLKICATRRATALNRYRAGRREQERTCLGSLFGELEAVLPKIALSLCERVCVYRSADWLSAVSRIGNPRAPADCQSAKQQITNLRYAKSSPPSAPWTDTVNTNVKGRGSG